MAASGCQGAWRSSGAWFGVGGLKHRTLLAIFNVFIEESCSVEGFEFATCETSPPSSQGT